MSKNGNNFLLCTNFCSLINNVRGTTKSKLSMKKKSTSKASSSLAMVTLKRKLKNQSLALYLITSTELKRKTNFEPKSREPLFLKGKRKKEMTKFLMRTIMKKNKNKIKINFLKSLSIVWRNKNKATTPMKCKKKINKKLTNHLNLIIWALLKMDVKLLLKSHSTWRNSWWLRSCKRFLKTLLWSKSKASDLQLYFNEKVEFLTFKQRGLTLTFLKSSPGLISKVWQPTISKPWLKSSEFKQQETFL